jgi:fucose permease
VGLIFGVIFFGLGLFVFFWFFKNKPKGGAADMLMTPQVLLTDKGRKIVILIGLSALAIGAFLLWPALNL